jgi:hypothetical protein
MAKPKFPIPSAAEVRKQLAVSVAEISGRPKTTSIFSGNRV